MLEETSERALLKLEGVTYPRVESIGDRPVQRGINASIRAAAYTAVPDFDPGTTLVEADSKYLTTLNGMDVLSLKFQAYIYPEMAAHGATGQSSLTVDLISGEVYDFNDLFRPGSGYQALLNQLIAARIAALRIPLLKPFEGVGPDEDYYLTPESLVVYYQPYVYTPGFYGVLEFAIPYAEIATVIDPGGPIGRILQESNTTVDGGLKSAANLAEGAYSAIVADIPDNRRYGYEGWTINGPETGWIRSHPGMGFVRLAPVFTPASVKMDNGNAHD